MYCWNRLQISSGFLTDILTSSDVFCIEYLIQRLCRTTSPGLEEKTTEDQRVGFVNVTFHLMHQISLFFLRDDLARQEPVVNIFSKVQEQRTVSVPLRRNTGNGFYLNIYKACFPQHAGSLSSHAQIDFIHMCVGEKDIELVPGRQRRIADETWRIGLMERNRASRSNQSRHLGDNLLGMGYMNQDKSCGRKVEGIFRKTCRAAVPVGDLHVGQLAVGDELPREAHGILTSSTPTTVPAPTRSANKSR